MDLFAGMAAGWGEAQSQHNAKMLDFVNQKSQTMAQLYGHLADTIIQSGGDQDIAMEFMNRAKGWASANPVLDPKGYAQLRKGEKDGLHGIVDTSHQKTVSDYMNKTYGGQQQENLGQFLDRIRQQNAENQRVRESQHIPESGIGPVPPPPVQPEPSGAQQVSDALSGKSGPPQGMTITPGAQTQTGQAGMGMPNIQDMMSQLTGGQPMFGALGAPTAMGKMAMQVAPEVMKQRMEMQYKMNLMRSMMGSSGMDSRSPSGSAMMSEMMRSMGINYPVTQWRPISKALFQDENGNYYVSPAIQSWRDGSTWIRTGPGKEMEATPLDENVQVQKQADGSLFALTAKGPLRLNGRVPVQTGSADSFQIMPGGETARQSQKQFSPGQSFGETTADGFGTPLDGSGPPGVGTVLPAAPPSGSNMDGGPPNMRTSTQKPSNAYQSNRGYDLAKLEQSPNPIERQIAKFITHPEGFDATGQRREMWQKYFDAATGNQVDAPVALKEFKTDYQKQRMAIVNGFHAAKNIGNILNSTDGTIVGFIAGRWMEAMNKLGLSGGIKLLQDGLPGQVTPESIQSIMPQLVQQRPELAHLMGSARGNELAAKAADLITSMRLFNFADVKNTVGGVQGVSRVYSFLKDSLMDPRMDMPFILGHLGSLNRNMADGLLTLEEARWGKTIPYIREKAIMSQLYWDPHVEQLIQKYQAAASSKGVSLNREDALFYLWRSGNIEADPGDIASYAQYNNAIDTSRNPGVN